MEKIKHSIDKTIVNMHIYNNLNNKRNKLGDISIIENVLFYLFKFL